MNIPRENNFGIIRYLLAFAVVVFHFNFLTDNHVFCPLSSYEAVGCFFALSGFLVSKSYRNSSGFKDYFFRRARRIIPSYTALVTVCAIGLCFVSTLSVTDYFTSPELYKYLAANITFLNFLHPTLPGVFAGSHTQAVNASLWTLKIEWLLYLTMPAILHFVSRSRITPLKCFIGIYLLSVAIRFMSLSLAGQSGHTMFNIISRFWGCACFYFAGVTIYTYFDFFARHKWIIAAIAALLLPVSYINEFTDFMFRPATLSIIVMFIAITGKWATWSNRNNISYDIYLCHFPVIQLLITTGCTGYFHTTWTLFVTVILLTSLSGATLWFTLGKRYLKRH